MRENSSFIDISGATTLATSTPLPVTNATGTIHKFAPAQGADKVNRNGIQASIITKLFNICAMPVYEKKSMEVKS